MSTIGLSNVIRNEALRKCIVANGRRRQFSGRVVGHPWYSIIEMHALSEHVQHRLHHVRAPCLAAHASQDDVSSLANAELQWSSVQGPVEKLLQHNSCRMITIDGDRRVLTDRIVAFVLRIADPPNGTNRALSHGNENGNT